MEKDQRDLLLAFNEQQIRYLVVGFLFKLTIFQRNKD